MSLLLDALKKAEQEKQKAHEAETASEAGVQEAEKKSVEQAVGEETVRDAIEKQPVESSGDELEFTLDESHEQKQELKKEVNELEVPEPALAPPIELEKNAATTSTVSSEALQLLVYKTNKKYRQRQRLAWGGLLSMAILILLSAGTYYYFGMIEEVTALEHKHKLAMRAVNAEPVKRYQPPSVKKSVELASEDQELANKLISNLSASETAQVEVVKSAIKKSGVKKNYLVKKTKISDPVSALLRDAWLSYNRKDYESADNNYKKVLLREPNNRDAILGISAIAVKNNEYGKARKGYKLLLKLDPRDQVAVAAMSNLENASAALADESKLKFMLQQQPNAAHLSFALGNYYAKGNRWPEAQSAYFKAWQGDSKNADYVYNLAVSLDQLGKTSEALRFYNESLVLARNSNIGFSESDVEKRIRIISDK